MSNWTINGHAYSDDGSQPRDLRYGGWRTWFPALMSDISTVGATLSSAVADAAAASSAAQNYAESLSAGYAGSLTIGAGAHSFTVQTGKQFAAGQYVMVIRSADSAYYLWGPIASYDAGTGELVVDAIACGGSGSYSGWVVALSGLMGPEGAPPRNYIRTKGAAYTAVLGDMGCLIDCSGTWTLSLTGAATLGDGWYVTVRNAGSGTITLDPVGAGLIDGAASVSLPAGQMCLIQCTGSEFKTTLTTLAGLRKRPILSDTSGKTALSAGEWIDSVVPTGLTGPIGRVVWTGTLFIAASTTAQASCATSPTGQTWTLRTLPSSIAAGAMASIGATVVLVQPSSAAAAHSIDNGLTWTSLTLPAATGSSPTIGVVGGLFVLAHTAATGTAYYTSPDGATWTARTFPASGQWAVSTAPCGGRLFATAASVGTAYYTSPDGINWTARSLPQPSPVGRFHTCGQPQVDGSYLYAGETTVYSSSDGINWTAQPASIPVAYYAPFRFRGAWLMTRNTGPAFCTASDLSGVWTPRQLQCGNLCRYDGKFAIDHAAGNLASFTGVADGKVQTINTSTPVVYGLFGD